MNDHLPDSAPSATDGLAASRPVGFERRLLEALTAADTAARRPVAAGARQAMRIRLAFLGAAALLVAGGGAAIGAIYLGAPTFQAAAEAVVAGDTLTLKGSGCAPGGPVAVSLDGGPRLASVGAAADGTFIVELALPAETAEGDHVAVAACRDGAGRDLVQRAGFAMLATRPPVGVALAVAGSTEPGGAALAKGVGCRPGSDVTVALDGHRALGTAITDGVGGFVFEFSVPPDTTVGSHELSASCPALDGSPLSQRTELLVALPEPTPPASKVP